MHSDSRAWAHGLTVEHGPYAWAALAEERAWDHGPLYVTVPGSLRADMPGVGDHWVWPVCGCVADDVACGVSLVELGADRPLTGVGTYNYSTVGLGDGCCPVDG